MNIYIYIYKLKSNKLKNDTHLKHRNKNIKNQNYEIMINVKVMKIIEHSRKYKNYEHYVFQIFNE